MNVEKRGIEIACDYRQTNILGSFLLLPLILLGNPHIWGARLDYLIGLREQSGIENHCLLCGGVAVWFIVSLISGLRMEKDWGFNAENVLVGFDGSVSVKPVVY